MPHSGIYAYGNVPNAFELNPGDCGSAGNHQVIGVLKTQALIGVQGSGDH